MRFGLAALGVGISICLRGAEPAQKQTQTNAPALNKEIERAIAEFGGSAKPLSAIGKTNFPFTARRDQDGVQIFCGGDHRQEVEDALAPVYGKPRLVQTNRLGAISFDYTIRDMGVAFQCASANVRGSNFTQIIILRANAMARGGAAPRPQTNQPATK